MNLRAHGDGWGRRRTEAAQLAEEASEEIIADRETILKLSGEGNNEWRKDPMPARGPLRLRKVGSLNKIQGTRER